MFLLFTTFCACSLIRVSLIRFAPCLASVSLPQRGSMYPAEGGSSPLFTRVRRIGILRSSELPWCSGVLCATAHIHPPHTGVCCSRYGGSGTSRDQKQPIEG